jgi:hypothetical protein
MGADQLFAQPLAYAQIGQVFPLLQLVGETCTAQQWELFAAAIVDAMAPRPPAAGIMTLQDDRGYIQGLFRYRASRGASGGATLLVDDVVALAMFERSLVEALDRNLEELAREHGCGVIDIGLPLRDGSRARPSRLCMLLMTAGYAMSDGSLRKSLA